MSPAALPVMSVNPAPGVSTRSVALAINCGVTSTMADMRPGMDTSRSALAHDVFLQADDHIDQPPPRSLEVVFRARDILLGRQFDRQIVAFVSRPRQVRWRPRRWWRRLGVGNFPAQRRTLVVQLGNRRIQFA